MSQTNISNYSFNVLTSNHSTYYLNYLKQFNLNVALLKNDKSKSTPYYLTPLHGKKYNLQQAESSTGCNSS